MPDSRWKRPSFFLPVLAVAAAAGLALVLILAANPFTSLAEGMASSRLSSRYRVNRIRIFPKE